MQHIIPVLTAFGVWHLMYKKVYMSERNKLGNDEISLFKAATYLLAICNIFIIICALILFYWGLLYLLLLITIYYSYLADRSWLMKINLYVSNAYISVKIFSISMGFAVSGMNSKNKTFSRRLLYNFEPTGVGIKIEIHLLCQSSERQKTPNSFFTGASFCEFWW